MSSSKISLNFHGHTVQSGGNMRTFEIPATGTLQIIDRYHHHWFVERKEIISFDSIHDLKDKINYFLKNDNERVEIALSGQKRAYLDHTYKNRVSDLMRYITK